MADRHKRGRATVQYRRVYSVVRRQRGHEYVYPRLTLDGGGLDMLGLKAGDQVIVETRGDEIRIRPAEPCSAPGCNRAARRRGRCEQHAARRSEKK